MPWPIFLALAGVAIAVDWQRLPPFTSLVVAILFAAFALAFRSDPNDKWR
jgi:hypothetical protein